MGTSKPNKKARRVFANKKQQLFLASNAKRKTFQGARASGKSFVLGYHIGLIAFHSKYQMPRSKGFMAGVTFNNLLTKTMAAVLKAFDSLGLKEYDHATAEGDFVKFKRPPSHWPKPYDVPEDYKYVITFSNGTTCELLSNDRPDNNRGGSYDWGMIDESALFDEESVTTVYMPSVRGNVSFFGKNPWHQMICDFTSTPWLPSGQWIYKTRDLMKLHGKDKYLFVQATAMDNVKAVGEDYLERMREVTPPLIFAVEYMNEPLSRMPNTFYPSFSEMKHCKNDEAEYEFQDGVWVPSQKGFDSMKPLIGSSDFNAGFTSMLIAQERGSTHKQIWFGDCLYVSDGKGQENVVEGKNMMAAISEAFIAKYSSHVNKVLELYGDPGGYSRQVNNDLNLYEVFRVALQKAGWSVKMNASRSYPRHRAKHEVIDTILSERDSRMPKVRIDIERCKWLVISMQNSGMRPDFAKDKSSERKLTDQRRATHFSDCLDYLLVGRYGKSYALGSGSRDVHTA